MSDESSGVFNRPGPDAESALESAARHLRATPRPVGSVQAREREVWGGRQLRDLLAWARENRRLIDAADYLPLAERGGEEHRIWPSPDRTRIFKATYPGRCAFTVVAEGMGNAPELAEALPAEYLERLILQNYVFGDDLRLEGVAEEVNKFVIVTSQPTLIGLPVELEEIEEYMRRLAFHLLPGLSLGNPGALAFYRDLDEVAAFDAHPANFVKDQHGVILPIDLILVRADAALQAALDRFVA